MKKDLNRASDAAESPSMMEPMLIRDDAPQREALTELAMDLAVRAAGLQRSLPLGLRTALADLVRTMNCYYSNLIEDHNTHPLDIERALQGDYSDSPRKRDLQMEAKAHVAVQQWIDSGGLTGRATTVVGLRDIHRRFCSLLPETMLWVDNPDTGERVQVTPGALRHRQVRVGQHIPISTAALPQFLARFEGVYHGLGTLNSILAVAAAHHRLLWIHPFVDGNGRVARLMSHAMLLEALNADGVWSVARGLARNVDTYRSLLANCDLPRRNDLDGRGRLSEKALGEFTRFFLETCIDQVRFMESLVEADRLQARVLLWAEEECRLGHLPPRSGDVLQATLQRGELPRGDLPKVVGTGTRQARRVTAALTARGVLTSASSRAPLRMLLPAGLAERWLPGLFPG